jgi:hypothetical protein
MKAITLTQPWATLVAIGAKHFETRSWRTNHTGLLAIHAGKGIPAELGGEPGFRRICAEQPFFAALSAAGYTSPASLPRGEVVALSNLRGCYTTNMYQPDDGEVIRGWDDEYKKWKIEPALHERAFGDYSPDRYAWGLDEVINLAAGSADRYPCRGWQQVWNLPDEIAEPLEQRLSMAHMLL